MIQTSDLVILVLASSALAFGVFRWHQNTQDVSAITIPANSRVIAEPAITTPVAGTTRIIDGTALVSGDTTTSANNVANGGSTTENTVQPTRVIEPRVVTGVVTSESVTAPSSTTSSTSVEIGIHNVSSGDSLSRIAQRYGTDVSTLRELNGISGSVIQIGQEIRYPL